MDGLADAGRFEVEQPIISCNEEHRFLTLEQLEAVGRAPQRIILEPCGRNTAPALTVVALTVVRNDTDPVLLVMPADHVISNPQAFHRAVEAGAQLAVDGYVVTFGVVPSHPDTGYGYIRTDSPIDDPGSGVRASAIGAFVEKPDLETARQYLASANYLWNSGMFMMRATVWLDAIARYRPDILAACEKAVDGGAADSRFFRVDGAAFESCPSDSIDYAVMEKLTGSGTTSTDASIGTAVIPLDAGWSDIGSWRALLDLDAKSESGGNVIQGDVFTHETSNSLVIAGHRLVATVGIRDAVIIETADAVLVADKNKTQDVRQVVDWLKKSGREESKTHRRVYRPWGDYEQLDAGEGYQVKRLTVKPGAALSLQLHHKRAEHWVVVSGRAKVTRNEDTLYLSENESTYIPMGTKHRLENPGPDSLEVIEVQSGTYLGEDDIVRFEDRYNRNI
jgi:mannose-1-phosphate guanylyltransferase/mannose-6-phosphate isomerase